MNWDGRIRGNATQIPLADESVQCVITSPPYWGLRSYQIPESIFGGDPACEHQWLENGEKGGSAQTQGPTSCRVGRSNVEEQKQSGQSLGAYCLFCDAWRGQLGLEPTPYLFVDHIVEIFREVWRVLRPDGTVWLNLGDCYATGAGSVKDHPGGGKQGNDWAGRGTPKRADGTGGHVNRGPMTQPNRLPIDGLKPKDLVGIPWRVALALQDDGWWLRSDLIWSKKNCMPGSQKDRPTTSHEYIFLLTKSAKYYYDWLAIAEETSPDTHARYARGRSDDHKYADGGPGGQTIARSFDHNKRSVWEISTQGYPEAHFATFPESLPLTPILAGTSEAGVCACGSPWKRLVQTDYSNPGNRQSNGPRSSERKHEEFGSAGYEQRLESTHQTIGWEMTCDCDYSAPVRGGIVFDPFFGSGTVGRVAERLNRRWVGIDLGYQDLQAKRMQNIQRELV